LWGVCRYLVLRGGGHQQISTVTIGIEKDAVHNCPPAPRMAGRALEDLVIHRGG